MKLRKLTWLVLILALSTGFISGCTGSTTIANSWPGLLVDQDTAYLANNNQVYAVNVLNGNEIWRYPAEANNKSAFFAPPVLTADGQLIVGSYDYTLYSLNAANGTEKWTFKNAKNRYIGSPLVTDTAIYAPNTDNTLYALGLEGNSLWSFKTGGEQWSQPVMDPDGSKFYISSLDHYLYAISTDGQLIWKSKESLGGAIISSPTLGPDNILYVGSFGSKMFAINSKNGEILWSVPTNDWVWSGPALKDNVLYFGDLDSSFYALNAKNGNVLWKYTPDGPVVGAPLLTDEAIYFGTANTVTNKGTLYSLNYQGNVNWFKESEAKIYQSPVLAGDLLILPQVGKDHIMVAFDLNGNQKWVFQPEKK